MDERSVLSGKPHVGGRSPGASHFVPRGRAGNLTTVRTPLCVLGLAALILGLAGCAHWRTENLNINGAQQIAANDEAARRVDLVQLIATNSSFDSATARERLRKLKCPASDPGPFNGRGYVARTRECLEIATKIFYEDPLDQEERRNRVQARLIAAARAECKQFTEHLNSIHGYGNFGTGVLTTAFASAGAVVTDANTARIMAGLAAFSSGTRAEFNSDIFLQQTVPLLAKAIHAAEDSYYRETIAPSRAKSVGEYPLWDAVGDAFRFNDMCSLVSALGALDKSLQVAEDPGLDAVTRTLLKFNTARGVVDNKTTDSSSLAAGDSSSGLASGPSGGEFGLDSNSAVAAYVRATKALAENKRTLDSRLKELGDAKKAAADVTATTAALTSFQQAAAATLDSCKTKVQDEFENVIQQETALIGLTDPAERVKALFAVQKAQDDAQATARFLSSVSHYAASTLAAAARVLSDQLQKGDNMKPTEAADALADVGKLLAVDTNILPAAPICP